MSFDKPTIDDLLECYHSKALQNDEEGIMYVEKLRALCRDAMTPEFTIIPFYDSFKEVFSYEIHVLGEGSGVGD